MCKAVLRACESRKNPSFKFQTDRSLCSVGVFQWDRYRWKALRLLFCFLHSFSVAFHILVLVFCQTCGRSSWKPPNLDKLDFVETRATQSASDGWAPGDGYMAYVHHPPRLCQEVHLSPACAKFSRETNKFSLCQAVWQLSDSTSLELIHLRKGPLEGPGRRSRRPNLESVSCFTGSPNWQSSLTTVCVGF